MDVPGTSAILAAVVCFILALQYGGVTKPWGSSEVVGLLVGFVLLTIVFGINEYFQGERALLQGRILKMRIIWVACLYVIGLAGGFFILLYELPIYFQSVNGVTPSESGIRNIPFVIAISLFTVLSGGLISKFGHFVPLMIISSIIGTIGTGMIYTLGVGSPSSHWIGYQVLAGIGFGLGFQIPIITAQASVEPEDISSASAMVLFFQTIGGSFFVAAGQTAFTNKLIGALPSHAPGVDAAKVVATGATELRKNFSAEELPGIIASYMIGIQSAFIIGIALVGASLFVALFAPWRKIDAAKAMGAS